MRVGKYMRRNSVKKFIFKAKVIKEKISNVLMMGRSRHCFVWCVQQRISASLFPTGIGAIDNFQICIGMGRL